MMHACAVQTHGEKRQGVHIDGKAVWSCWCMSVLQNAKVNVDPKGNVSVCMFVSVS